MTTPKPTPQFFNEDCIAGCRKRIGDDTVDLIVTDPPYGIDGGNLHKHYNRNEDFVLDGYVEVPAAEYAAFSRDWIAEAARILRPGGSLYIVSGYTHLCDILNALRETKLKEVNHLIWKYNFGVWTQKKYISSHYHLLYYVKPGGPVTFNAFDRFGATEKGADATGSLNYQDREDVWVINREYQPGKTKNKNQLPTQLLTKIIQYSSNEGDLVADLFLGSFSTAKVAIGLNRRAMGFEKSKVAFTHQKRTMKKVQPGELLAGLRAPEASHLTNQRKAWTATEKAKVIRRFKKLTKQGLKKKEALDTLSSEFGRGTWSLLKIVGVKSRRITTDKNIPLAGIA
ncbi:TPA: site-specific DNA-methyltransferase [Candidatus Sumerlaeota bacterium]|nr:site-specific DNA-methyltransferase [Candidatus Sumerlaeota bacterium]